MDLESPTDNGTNDAQVGAAVDVPPEPTTSEPAGLPAGEPPGEPTEPDRDPMAAVRLEVAALRDRMDELAATFESTVHTAVAEELQRVSGDLRHTVSELGRVLVRDLGRLSQILAQHRDVIIAELKEGKAPPPVEDQPA